MEFLSASFMAQQPPAHAPPKRLPILPLTALETLTRWADTAPRDGVGGGPDVVDASSASVSASAAASSSRPAAPSRTIQFPVSRALNQKLLLVQGDILGLKVDAIVNPTNERLSDFHLSPIATRLAAYAGPAFEEECRSLVRNEGGVATGDSALMSSHALGKLHGGARYVIHTVSPKYSAKYVTAAENALHGCVRRSLEVLLDQAGCHTIAFPLIATHRKHFPPEEAAHLTFRTLRKFLDRYGNQSITTVVLCLQEKPPQPPHATHEPSASTVEPALDEDEIFRLWQRILPLYFPRSESEAALQLVHLPASTGNELGETVVEERSIRIAYGQFIAAGPTPFSPEEREHHHQQQQQRAAAAAAADHSSASAAASSTTHSSSSSSFAAASSSFVAPLSSSLRPSKTEYVSAEDMPAEPTQSRAPTAHPPIVYKDSSSFSAAQENPDAARSRQFTTASSSHERLLEQQENHRYYEHLKRAQSCRHADMTVLDAANYIYEDPRRDILGRRVIHIVGQRVPLFEADGTARVSREHFADHLLRTLDPLTLHPFVAIYYHAGVDHTNRVDMVWLRGMYSEFTRSQKANLKKLIIVHPTLYLRSALWLGLTFVSQSFWANLVYAHQLSDLQGQHIDARALAIPPQVLHYDRVTYGVTPLTAKLDEQDEVGL